MTSRALLVVDMQNGFCHPDGSFGQIGMGLEGAQEAVRNAVVTNLCVETTVRSAFMRDYPVTLLADCCAAKTRRLHDLSVEVLTGYELAAIARVSEGYDLALTPIPA